MGPEIPLNSDITQYHLPETSSFSCKSYWLLILNHTKVEGPLGTPASHAGLPGLSPRYSVSDSTSW